MIFSIILPLTTSFLLLSLFFIINKYDQNLKLPRNQIGTTPYLGIFSNFVHGFCLIMYVLFLIQPWGLMMLQLYHFNSNFFFTGFNKESEGRGHFQEVIMTIDSVGGNGGEALRGEKIGIKRDIRDLSCAFNECYARSAMCA